MTHIITKKVTNLVIYDISVCCIPDKLFADRAEGRLREERSTELVTFDNMDFGLFDRTASLMQGKQTLSVPLGLGVSISLTWSV